MVRSGNVIHAPHGVMGEDEAGEPRRTSRRDARVVSLRGMIVVESEGT